MKKLVLVLSAATLFLSSCESNPQADNAAVGDAQTVDSNAAGNTYNVDAANSMVSWIGTKPVGKHNGTIPVKDGSINVAEGNITGGKFTMDLTGLKALDQDSAGNAKLGGHLQSPDFFDVAKFPNATFEITQVTAGIDTTQKDLIMKDATHTITGNLTLKEVTKSISFPAKVSVSDNTISADANFNIDRTNWNLSYGNDKSLGDKFIYPIVNVGFKISATK